MKDYQKKRKFDTQKKVLAVINNLKKSNKKITYNLVAEKANVSTSTLYKNPMFKEKIRQAKAIQLLKLDKSELNSSNKKLVLNKKNTRNNKEKIDRLKSEIKNIKRANKLLLGNLEKKSTEVIELKTKLETLKKIKNIHNT